MVGRNLLDSGWIQWGILLIVAFPFAVAAVGEVIHWTRRWGPELVPGLRLVRNLFLPMLVVLAFIRLVLEADGGSTATRLVTTLVWVLGIGAGLSLVNALVFRSATDDDTWRGRTPRLLVDIARTLLLVIGITVVVALVWGRNPAGVFAALGITGVIIGLALQNTLAGIISGIALLSDRPFVVGDWIETEDVSGKVTDINWRTVRLVNREDDAIVVPNVVFTTSIIVNNSRPEPLHDERIKLRFSHDDPPNLVRQVLQDVAATTPDVLTHRPVRVDTLGYGDHFVEYEVWLPMENYDVMPRIRSDFLTRVWYAAQRHRITMPVPRLAVADDPGPNAADDDLVDGVAERVNLLTDVDLSGHDLGALVATPRLLHYAEGEYLSHEGAVADGIHLIVAGRAVSSVIGGDGSPVTVGTRERGDLVGAVALRPGSVHLFTVQAVTDLEAVVLEPAAVRALTDRNAAFAGEMEDLLQSRRAAAGRARRQRPRPDLAAQGTGSP